MRMAGGIFSTTWAGPAAAAVVAAVAVDAAPEEDLRCVDAGGDDADVAFVPPAELVRLDEDDFLLDADVVDAPEDGAPDAKGGAVVLVDVGPVEAGGGAVALLLEEAEEECLLEGGCCCCCVGGGCWCFNCCCLAWISFRTFETDLGLGGIRLDDDDAEAEEFGGCVVGCLIKC